MKVALLIPARYQSSRFPGKPLAPVRGASGQSKPLIQRSFEAAERVRGVASVHVLTDDDRIAEAASAAGADVLMTSAECRNGTERCAEVLDRLDAPDIVVNFQGDALLTPPGYVEALIERMRSAPDAEVATIAFRLSKASFLELQAEERAGRVGGTSVVTDGKDLALYFSKRLIPYVPTQGMEGDLSPVRLHVGVYAYRPDALRRYAASPPSTLELLEGLEQLRFLVAGIRPLVVEVGQPAFSLRELNNPEDIAPIEQVLLASGIA